MSAAEQDGRAAHLDAFALLVRDGLMPHRKAVDALLRRDYFSEDRRDTGRPTLPGQATARGNAWLVDTGLLTFSEGTYLVARSLRAKGAAEIDTAMHRAERLLAQTLTQLDEQRTRTARELTAAMEQVKPTGQAMPKPQAAAPSPLRMGGMA